MAIPSTLKFLLNYYKQNGSYYDGYTGKRCLICNTGDMYSKSRKKHHNSLRHASNHNAIINDTERAIDAYEVVRIVSERIEKITLNIWKNELKAKMFDYMKSISQPQRSQLYSDIQNSLRKYERMEVSSLLELAVWKSEIVNGVEFDSIQELREYSTLKEDFNVTSFCMDRRTVSGIEVIVPNVMQFLR